MHAEFERFSRNQEGKPSTWTFPKSGSAAQASGNPVPVTLPQLQQELAKLKNQLLPELRKETPPSQSVVATPSIPGTSAATFASPLAHPLRNRRTRCSNNDCTFGKFCLRQHRYPVTFICNEAGCNYEIHAACLGFPDATDEDLQAFKKYYCPSHQMKNCV